MTEQTTEVAATKLTGYASLKNATKAAQKSLGENAKQGLDFDITCDANGRYQWHATKPYSEADDMDSPAHIEQADAESDPGATTEDIKPAVFVDNPFIETAIDTTAEVEQTPEVAPVVQEVPIAPIVEAGKEVPVATTQQAPNVRKVTVWGKPKFVA